MKEATRIAAELTKLLGELDTDPTVGYALRAEKAGILLKEAHHWHAFSSNPHLSAELDRAIAEHDALPPPQAPGSPGAWLGGLRSPPHRIFFAAAEALGFSIHDRGYFVATVEALTEIIVTGDGDDEQESSESLPAGPSLSKIEQAICVKRKNKTWTMRQVANHVGCSVGTLSGSDLYKTCAKIAETGGGPPRGTKGKDGSIEAKTDDDE